MIPIAAAQGELPGTAGAQVQQAALADALFCSLFGLLAAAEDPEKPKAPWAAAVAAAPPELTPPAPDAGGATAPPAHQTTPAGAATAPQPQGPAVVAFLARLRTAAPEPGAAETAKQVFALSHVMAAGAALQKREPSPERLGVEGPVSGHLFSPFRTMPAGTAMETPPRSTASLAAYVAEMPETKQVETRAVVRELAVRLPENVEIRVAERAGEIRVAVRANDPAVAQTLRQSLPELSAGLERAGYHAQIWAPPAAAAEGKADTSDESARRERRQPRERPKRSTGEAKWHPPFRL